MLARSLLLHALVVVLLSACRRKHVPVGSAPELGYPVCDAAVPGEIVARGQLRSGPISQEKNVVEHFTLKRDPCGYVFSSRQEWPLTISDVEAHFDSSFLPSWAWKRMTIAGSRRDDGYADIRRYELRTGEVFIKRRDPAGEVTLEKLLRGGRMRGPERATVGAVVGPGRGIITAWLKREKLPVGGKVSELVLDFREVVESLEMATLERHEDQVDPSLGGRVRVYTFFGRETVFADEDDVVVGDLAGMRPSRLLSTPEPEPLPMYGGPDPAHTP